MVHPCWEQIKDLLPWKPNLSLTIDAGWHFSTKPDCLSAIVGTDPHVINYDPSRLMCDQFFNMQYSYLKVMDGHIKNPDVLLPYAFDPWCHAPMDIPEEYDAVLIGLH